MITGSTVDRRFGLPLSLATDLYQISMGQAYFDAGWHERPATFHLFFRKAPFGGAYGLFAGLEDALAYLSAFQVTPEEITYLRSLRDGEGQQRFSDAYLDYLRDLRFTCDVHAMQEGTVCFPHEPLVRVTGPLMQAQWVETLLLNQIGFASLVATKASRVVRAAKGRPVLEFGMRRAQGLDGAVTVARSARIGGCVATSHVLAGALLGVDVLGTHAHSLVMAFGDEEEAFKAYAASHPQGGTLLVDTYDTPRGVDRAIRVAQELRANGGRLGAIRLDSGDLTALAKEARRRLDAAGFPDVRILASNDLDEHRITELLLQGAPLDAFGVGTRLATCHDQPSMGVVYKLGAVWSPEDGDWSPRMKQSATPKKRSIPGRLTVTRGFNAQGQRVADVIHDVADRCPDRPVVPTTLEPLEAWSEVVRTEEVLQRVMRKGRRVVDPVPLETIAAHAKAELEALPGPVLALSPTEAFPVGWHAERTRVQRQCRDAVLEREGAP